MMIKCTKCGFENQMGAIFCRQCGEKIDMNEISPESLESELKKEKAKKRVLSAVRWTVRILVLGLLVGGIAAALIPWGLPVYVEPDKNADEYKKQKESALFKLQFYSAEKIHIFPETEKISIDELNILFNEHLLKPGENKTATWVLDHVFFIANNDRITMQVFIRIFDTVPAVLQFTGLPELKSGSDKITFQLDSAVAGRLPLAFCNKLLAEKIESIFNEDDELARVFKRTESITLKNNKELIFRFRQQKKEASEAAIVPAEDTKTDAAPVVRKTKKKRKSATKD